MQRTCKFSLTIIILSTLFLFSPPHTMALDTGPLTAGSNAARIGAGDGNGFESGAGATTVNDNIYASSVNTGTGNAVDGCTTFNQSEDDAHDFYNFNISPAAGSTINGVNITTTAKWSTNSGTNQLCIGLSWDGGASWTSAIGTGDLSTTKATNNLGGAANTWGRTWTVSDLSNTNFRLRVMIDPGASNTTTAYLDYLAVTVYYTPPASTILGNGVAEPSDLTLAPGDAITDLDAFSLVTSAGTDTVTAATVTLATDTYPGISSVSITSDDGATTYFSPVTPTGNTVDFSGGTPIPITSSVATYKIRVTPKSPTSMASPPGSTYVVTGTITSFASTNARSGSDTGSATITIDNTSPGNVTGGSVTAGIGQVALSWVSPTDSDFSQVVVLRRAAAAVTDTPTEGVTYSVGNTVGSSTVACVTGTTSCLDSGLTGDTAYYYQIFAKDSRCNYSSGGTAPTGSPATPSPIIVSVSISSSGVVSYGFVGQGSAKDTTASGLNNTQTVYNDGNVPVDLTIQTTNALGGTGWTLGSAAGPDIFVHEFSLNSGGGWTKFSSPGTYQSFLTNLAVSSSQNFDLRLTAPSSSTDLQQKSVTVTLLATQH